MDKYLALPDGAGRFPQDFSGPVVLRDTARPFALRLQGFHLLRRCFPGNFNFSARSRMQALQPRCSRNYIGLGYSPFARHYLGNHYCFLFLCIQHEMTFLQNAGLPHSEIHGSMHVCYFPRLIAAYHVLHRLSMPRHPP